MMTKLFRNSTNRVCLRIAIFVLEKSVNVSASQACCIFSKPFQSLYLFQMHCNTFRNTDCSILHLQKKSFKHFRTTETTCCGVE